MTDTPMPETTPKADDPPPWLSRPVTFMDHVARVCATPGGRADLRTGQSPAGLEEPWRMLPHLLARIPSQSGRDGELAHLACAAMFAAQAGNPSTTAGKERATTYNPVHGNLGWSLARAVRTGVLREESAADRLQLLARQGDLPALLRHVRPLAGRLSGENITVSWPRLLRDLTRWSRFRTDVARDWMRAYYAPEITDSSTSQTAEENH